MTGSAARGSSALFLALLLTGTFLANLWGIGWGLPPASSRAWDHDEIAPKYVTSATGRGILRSYWPKKYPPLQYWLLRPVYAAAGALGPQEPFASAWPDSYTQLYLAGRLLSVLQGTLTVLFLWFAAREVLDPLAARFAAVVAALPVTSVFYAKLANLDVPYVFWFSISLWLFVRVLKRHRALDYAGFALTAAAAVCTKDQAYALYALSPIPIVLSLRRRRAADGRPAALVRLLLDRRLLAATVTGAGTFLVIHEIPFDGGRWFGAHYDRITGPYTAAYRMFERSLAGEIACLRLAVRNAAACTGWPVMLACLTGVALALLPGRRRESSVLRATLVLPVSYYATLIAVILYHYERYFMPVVLVLALFGGDFLARLWRSERLPQPVAALLVCGVVAHGALRSLELELLVANDSRNHVEEWVSTHAGSAPALAVGEPQMSPRLRTVAWTSLVASEGAALREQQADVVVFNLTDLATKGGQQERAIYRRMLDGDLGYELAFTHRYRPPFHLLDLSGTTGSLLLVNPELAVFRRTGSPWPDWYAALAGLEPGDLVRRANAARRAGDVAQARRSDAAALARQPGDVLALLGLAEDARSAGDTSQAEARAREATAAAPRSPAPRLGLARALAAQGRSAEARAAADGALALAGRSALAWAAAADVLADAGARRDAYAALGHAEALAAAAWDARTLAGVAEGFAALGARERAERVGLAAVRLAAAQPASRASWAIADASAATPLARLARRSGRSGAPESLAASP